MLLAGKVHADVIFSMLLTEGLNISQPHLLLFLTCAAYEIDSTICA